MPDKNEIVAQRRKEMEDRRAAAEADINARRIEMLNKRKETIDKQIAEIQTKSK